jgi:hypothetical protein
LDRPEGLNRVPTVAQKLTDQVSGQLVVFDDNNLVSHSLIVTRPNSVHKRPPPLC